MAIDRAGISVRMKNQTFGVEIEMYDITRQEAARIAAEFFGTGRYENTAYSDGYRAWSAWDKSGRKWKFVFDCSICEDDDYYDDDKKCELTTPILTYDDIPVFQELIRTLRKAGAKSDPAHKCGVHIHVGTASNDHTYQTAQSLTNLTNLMASHENLLISSIGVDYRRIDRFCETVNRQFLESLNAQKPKTLDAFADIWYTTQPCRYRTIDDHYHNSRYHMLNLHAVFTKGTIEFRFFNFKNPGDGKHNGLHAGMVKSWIQLCLAMTQFAKDSKFCKSPRCAEVNSLRTMRNFINNIGLGGDEFVTLRHILTANFHTTDESAVSRRRSRRDESAVRRRSRRIA